MKRYFLIFLSVLLISVLLLGSCGEPETTTPTTTTPTSTQPTETEPTMTTPEPPPGPESGGTLRIIAATGLVDLGWPPAMNPTDESIAKAYTEALVAWGSDGDFMPELAESWDLDMANKTITFQLREGVKFHDGTDFDAEAVRYCAQLRIDSQRMVDAKYIDSLEVVDDYTFRYNLNTWINPAKALHSWAYGLTIYSPAALEKGEEANTTSFVSTGPFKFDSFEQDVFLKLTKFDGYWRGPEYPYLDGIEYKFFADTTTAAAAMQAGEGDAWLGQLKEALDLEAMGMNVATQVNMYTEIVPDNKSPGSVWKDKKVREALEYAIDKEALAEGLGYGRYKPMKMLAPEGSKMYLSAT